MSTLVEQPQAANPFQAPRTAHNARRRAANYAIIALSLLATAFAVAVLLYLLLYVLGAGLPYINLDLFTKIPTANGEPGGGLAPSIQGSRSWLAWPRSSASHWVYSSASTSPNSGSREPSPPACASWSMC